MCRANGSRFLLVIPPSYQKGAEAITEVGADQRVTVMVPVAKNTLDASYYQSDVFHLNPRGARIFTERLATNLLDELPK